MYITVSGEMEKNMDLADTLLPTKTITRANSLTEIDVGRANMPGLMAVSTTGSGRRTR